GLAVLSVSRAMADSPGAEVPRLFSPLLLLTEAAPPTPPKPERNVEGIMDNSFLIEEAYNQEPGVVQHILNVAYGLNRLHGSDEHDFGFTFTQEWPIFSQTHQFSYTIPYSLTKIGSNTDKGLGDVFLNYRYQVFLDERTLTGFAPRFSLVLPTGDTQA